jgi:hypothetical protein
MVAVWARWSLSISVRVLTPRELPQLSGAFATLPFFQDLLDAGRIKPARDLDILNVAQSTVAKPNSDNNVATLNYHVPAPIRHNILLLQRSLPSKRGTQTPTTFYPKG